MGIEEMFIHSHQWTGLGLELMSYLMPSVSLCSTYSPTATLGVYVCLMCAHVNIHVWTRVCVCMYQDNPTHRKRNQERPTQSLPVTATAPVHHRA
jgi:hypothetical protein